MTGAPLHLIDRGPANAPVLVLLHSIATSAAMWDDQIAALSDRFCVIALDLPGHGQSPALGGEPTVADYADAVTDALAPVFGGRAVFVGLSFGSMIAQQIGARYPDRVAGLVLSNGVAYAPPPVGAAWQDRIAAAEAEGMASQVGPTLARWFTPEFLASNAGSTADAVVRIGQLIADTPVQGYVEAARAIAELDNRALLPTITAPTLVLAGEGDTAAPAQAVATIADAVPGATYRVLPGAHLINVEHSETYTRMLVEFVDGIAGSTLAQTGENN